MPPQVNPLIPGDLHIRAQPLNRRRLARRVTCAQLCPPQVLDHNAAFHWETLLLTLLQGLVSQLLQVDKLFPPVEGICSNEKATIGIQDPFTERL